MASKGDKFRSEAESTVQSTQFSLSSIFGFGKAQKLEEAAELYIKAGNVIKLIMFYLFDSTQCLTSLIYS